jgi:hypothetical protein
MMSYYHFEADWFLRGLEGRLIQADSETASCDAFFSRSIHDVARMIDHECAGREASCLDMLRVAFTMRACETAQGF